MNKLEDFKTVEKEEDEENPILNLILNSFLRFLVVLNFQCYHESQCVASESSQAFRKNDDVSLMLCNIKSKGPFKCFEKVERLSQKGANPKKHIMQRRALYVIKIMTHVHQGSDSHFSNFSPCSGLPKLSDVVKLFLMLSYA